MTLDVDIRRATPADAEAIAAVHLDSWDAAYRGLIADAYIDLLLSRRQERADRWRTILETADGDDRTWVVERAGEVLGFCGTGPARDEDAIVGTGEVLALYLRPGAVGTGIGRQLFAHAVVDLHERGYAPLTLWVLRQNDRGRRFYEAAGWRPDGAQKVETRPGASLDEVRYRWDG